MSLVRAGKLLALAICLSTGCPTPQQDSGSADYRSQHKRLINAFKYNAFKYNALTTNALTLNALSQNALSLNALTSNALTANALSANALSANALTANALSSNALSPNGTVLEPHGNNIGGIQGLTLLSITYQGASDREKKGVSGVGLRGSELVVLVGDQILTGAAVVGLEYHYKFQPTGTQQADLFTIRFAEAKIDQTAKVIEGQTNDVWQYDIQGRSDNTQNEPYSSLCLTETGAPDHAILLANRWDPVTVNRIDSTTAITMACRDFPLGKCARAGYKPWSKSQSCTGSGTNKKCTDVSLVDHHQACVRMMRADYCGNGTGYTVNGTLIDIYDYLNPPINVPESDWDIEARWTPTGAICINEPRHPELVGKWKRPDCNGDGKPDSFPACGQSDNRYSGKGLVVDRFDDDQSGTKK